MNTVVLNLEPITHLTDEQFYQLCLANRDLNLEMNAAGELIIVPPVGGESGNQEADLITDLNNWNRQTKLGKVFSSSTIFILPNSAKRSPDAAWVKLERWSALTKEEQKRFPPLCPDFVVELRSESDVLAKLRLKMQEYQDNGARLGWLIDPQTPLVEIYRSQQEVEVLNFSLENPPQLLGEDVLPGFILDLTIILNP